MRRWFHRNQTQQLHQVVLHHIAHGTRFIVISATPANTYNFRDSDLNMINILRVPKWFEQQVTKAHGHQILHSFFAKVMINAIDLAFIKLCR